MDHFPSVLDYDKSSFNPQLGTGIYFKELLKLDGANPKNCLQRDHCRIWDKRRGSSKDNRSLKSGYFILIVYPMSGKFQ